MMCYDSYFTAADLLHTLAKVVEKNVEHIANSPAVTVLADKSTDIGNTRDFTDVYSTS